MSIIPEGVVTPEVLVDAEVLQGNIDRMAGAARARGLRLRPHVKTHKVKEIADLQLASGAMGLTVATVGEAEVFVADGALDVFIAYPLWVDAPRAARLRCLAERALVRLGVDSAEGATAMGQGLREAAADGGMNVVGVFTFPGHSYALGAALTAAQDEDVALASAAASLSEAGFEVLELSGGSTPTALLETTTSATELRPGVVLGSDRPPWASGWGRLGAAGRSPSSANHCAVRTPCHGHLARWRSPASPGRTVTGYPQSRMPDHEPGGGRQRRTRRSRRRPVGGSRPRLQQLMERHQYYGVQTSPGEPQGQAIVPAGSGSACWEAEDHPAKRKTAGLYSSNNLRHLLENLT